MNVQAKFPLVWLFTFNYHIDVTCYIVSSDFMSIPQGLVPEVIRGHKYYMDTGPILGGYGALDRN